MEAPLKPGKPRRGARTVEAPADPGGLGEEIVILRAALRWMVRMGDAQLTMAERLRLLDTLSKAATRLATLLKAERLLTANADVARELNRALAELLAELRPGGAPEKGGRHVP